MSKSIRFPVKIHIFLVSLVFITAFLNWPARLSPESDISLFRFIVPVLFIIFMGNTKSAVTLLLWFFYLLLALILFSYLNQYRISSVDLIFLTHYITLVIWFFFVYFSLQYIGPDNIYKIFHYFSLFLIILLALEFFLDFTLPNVEAKSGVLYGIAFNQNDLGLILFSLSLFFLWFSPHRLFSLAFLIFTSLVIIYNGSRLLILLLPFVFFWFFMFPTLKTAIKVLLLLVILFLTTVIILIYQSFLNNIPLSVLVDLLLDPIIRILTFDPYGFGRGSVFVRTDMTIYALQAFIDSAFIGIGPGNTVEMISTSRYGFILEGAGTIHNFPLQVLTEVGIIPYVILYFLWDKYRFPVAPLIVLAIASLSQSAGVFSNFIFLSVVFLFILLPIRSRRSMLFSNKKPIMQKQSFLTAYQ